MNAKQKHARIRALRTDTLRRIAAAVPDERPTAERPLAGQAHVTGIGQVPVAWVRAELEHRGEAR